MRYDDELFEKWLQNVTIKTIIAERARIVEADDEADDKAGDADGGDDDDDDDDVDEKELEKRAKRAGASIFRKTKRGGPRRPSAAQRKVPPPEPTEITPDMIIAKLNAIRSGRSFKDKGVLKRFGEYFDELDPAQRLALFAFLEGLAEIIALGVDGDDARMPDDPDVAIEIEKEDTEADYEERAKDTRVAKPEAEEYAGASHQHDDDDIIRVVKR